MDSSKTVNVTKGLKAGYRIVSAVFDQVALSATVADNSRVTIVFSSKKWIEGPASSITLNIEGIRNPRVTIPVFVTGAGVTNLLHAMPVKPLLP